MQDLFPQPRELREQGRSIELGDRPLQFDAATDAPPLVRRGIELVTLVHGGASGNAPYRIDVRLDPTDAAWPDGDGRDQAYTLDLGPGGGQLVAATAAGAFLGCQTLRQLVRGHPDTLPALRIVDWPDMRYRGLFVESKWGPDLMTLDDWKDVVDYMAALKLNVLSVGIYSCWVVQYGGKVTEFLMLPFPEHPALTTPKTLRYYSPASGAWETREYLPPMVTDDFFGELVAYGQTQNVAVVPHLNGPGHSTLIPKAYPEIAAKDEHGQPIGYGYCLSNPRTYELLFGLYDSIIERYLRPHGADWVEIGVDEVQAYAGVREDQPFASIEPWCQCAECRERPRDRQLQEYTVRLCAHLKEQGINTITMWDDGMRKEGALNADFVRMLDEAGVKENVAVQWWRYHEPTLVPWRDLGLRSWSQPMGGYWSWMFTGSYTSNISTMLLHGGRAGAEGGIVYCLFDLAFDRNYACLAQFSWNQTTGDDLYQFKSRYARSRLGGVLDRYLAVDAFEKYDQVFDALSWTETHLASLLYYWHTYPRRREQGLYPRDVFTELRTTSMRVRDAFSRAADNARAARDVFAGAHEQTGDPLLDQYRVECDKFVGVWESYLATLDGIGRYESAVSDDGSVADRQAALTEAAALIERGRERLAAVMADLERVKAAYLRPQILRDLSALYLYLDRLADEIRDLGADEHAPLPSFAELATNQEDLDRFLSPAAV